MSDYQVCCLDGFHADVVLKMLHTKPPTMPIIFDGGSYKYKTDQLMTLVDYPIFSERFTLPHSRAIQSLMEDCQIKTYAITRGFQSIEMHENKIKSFVEVPKVDAIDTLAAGDIFHGAFSYYILETNGDFKKSLIESVKIASLSCQFLGPVAWMQHFRKSRNIQSSIKH
jgi:sugar/nucleoside kinase (ribokinase family)